MGRYGTYEYLGKLGIINFIEWENLMLKVYGTKLCQHCTLTAEYLTKNHIEFEYLDIEKQSKDIVQKIIDVNGGDDWVVPTLEYNGRWRKGKVFNQQKLNSDLQKWGLFA